MYNFWLEPAIKIIHLKLAILNISASFAVLFFVYICTKVVQFIESGGTLNLTKNSVANFWTFPWANGNSLFPVWKTIIFHLEFFNDF